MNSIPAPGWVLAAALAVLSAAPSTFASRNRIEIVCPCELTQANNTAVGINLTIRSISTDATSGDLRLVLYRGMDVEFEFVGRLAELHLDPLAPGESHVMENRLAAWLATIEPEPSAHVLLVLFEGDELIERIRMDGTHALSDAGGSAFYNEHLDGEIYLASAPELELSGLDFDLDLGGLVNPTSVATGDLDLSLYFSEGPELFGVPLALAYQTVIEGGVAAGTELAEAVVSGQMTGLPGDDHDYAHILISRRPEDEDGDDEYLAWHTVVSPSTIVRSLSARSLDVLTDADGDGVSDFNEARFVDADPNDANLVPPSSRARVFFVATDRAANVADIEARLAFLTSFSNTVFEDSGVDLTIEMAGMTQVAVDDGLLNEDLLDLVHTSSEPFTDVQAQADAVKADLVIVIDSWQEDDSCGLAWLNARNQHGDFVPERNRAREAVVDLDCQNRALVHEIGHLMGLGHSRRQGAAGTFNWSVGHGVDETFVSVMAYPSEFADGVSEGLFSSPDVTCTGNLPCGVSENDPLEGANAVLSLNAVRYMVAAFSGDQPPTITLTGGATLYWPEGRPFVDPWVVVDDDGDLGLEAQVEATGFVDVNELGRYAITYRVADSDGNQAQAERIVLVDTDTDDDGLVDVIDEDDDGDALSDTYEFSFGLNALVADSSDDSDGDGKTNREEFEAGTDPSDAASVGTGANHFIRLVSPQSNDVQQGFIRVINKSSETVSVTLTGRDDAGVLSIGRIQFDIPPFAAQQMNSDDLEIGNAAKGLVGSLGDGFGNWQLQIYSDDDLTTMGFVRTSQGFMTSMHALSEAFEGGTDHRVDVFNPASNLNQVSRIRVSNLSAETAAVQVVGIDDAGVSGGPAIVEVGPFQTVELSATDLEVGSADKGVTGSLGDGVGKWRLEITASRAISVMSLLEAPGGYISNLSASQRGSGD